MNRFGRSLTFALVVIPGITFAPRICAQSKTTAGAEQFFIIASIDQAKSELLLKRPTEVTVLAKVSDKTRYLDDKGKPVELSELRAGDTVWVVSSKDPDGPRAIRIRKGQMTLAELHREYLDYPEIK
jgi:hypothetical protein